MSSIHKKMTKYRRSVLMHSVYGTESLQADKRMNLAWRMQVASWVQRNRNRVEKTRIKAPADEKVNKVATIV